MEIQLLIRSKTEASTREVPCAIGDGLVIGRGAEQGVLLDGPDLSREHLVLTTDGTHVYVTDLSVNGTWLNGNRLKRSVKTRVRTDDLIEVPGYALSFSPAEQPEKTGEAAIAHMPQPAPAPRPAAPSVPEPAEPVGVLDPVFRFIGSFSFGEKFLALVGVGGLLLLYIYVA
jgi:predicted component of type VI protein secretion system